MNPIEKTLSNVHVGSRASFRNLTIYPIFGTPRPNDYLILDEALANGAAVVTEVSEAGHVPELHFVNKSDMGVLLVDGEELIGAKQNRILNISILAPAQSAVRIPVSCVEAGRWRKQSQEFRTSPHAQYASGRAMKMRDVSVSMRGAERTSDQSAVWSDIDKKMRRMKASSSTRAMSDLFEQHAPAVEGYVGAFHTAQDQVGAGFLIGGRVVGIDLFDTPLSFEKLFPKLVRSYALDAIDRSTDVPLPVAGDNQEAQSLSDFLNAVASARYETFQAIGEGKDLRFSDDHVCVAALHARDRIVHLTAFAH